MAIGDDEPAEAFARIVEEVLLPTVALALDLDRPTEHSDDVEARAFELSFVADLEPDLDAAGPGDLGRGHEARALVAGRETELGQAHASPNEDARLFLAPVDRRGAACSRAQVRVAVRLLRFG